MGVSQQWPSGALTQKESAAGSPRRASWDPGLVFHISTQSRMSTPSTLIQVKHLPGDYPASGLHFGSVPWMSLPCQWVSMELYDPLSLESMSLLDCSLLSWCHIRNDHQLECIWEALKAFRVSLEDKHGREETWLALFQCPPFQCLYVKAFAYKAWWVLISSH